jgi:putative transposase
MAHTFTNLLTHIIFSTKNRMPTLEPELKQRLFPYMGGIFRELDGTPLLINGPADHVHVLAVLPAKLSVSEILNKVKSNSSGWVHKTFQDRQTFAWQVGYAAFGVSSSQKQPALDYIAGQEEHHRKISFKEEFLEFLKKHEIQYDEKYLWK